MWKHGKPKFKNSEIGKWGHSGSRCEKHTHMHVDFRASKKEQACNSPRCLYVPEVESEWGVLPPFGPLCMLNETV